VLKHCAANRNRVLSALPNVGPYIYNVKISGFTRSSIYIYDISRLRVKGAKSLNQAKEVIFVFVATYIHIRSVFI
jgi:hypothetical protein